VIKKERLASLKSNSPFNLRLANSLTSFSIVPGKTIGNKNIINKMSPMVIPKILNDFIRDFSFSINLLSCKAMTTKPNKKRPFNLMKGL